MNDHAIVHFATHASFIPGDPKQSFILFGNGETANLRDIENWTLKNVDLVVLSACETAVGIQAYGERSLGNGEEILGLGYQFQDRGAKATIASLWTVDDGGTQVLMDAFYARLKKGNLTKIEALQQAQIALMKNDRSLTQLLKSNAPNGAQPIYSPLDHPYYWAPFILIGNGL
ncbi:CHAT domain-containing protein [Phormidesmis sp. 146-33]